MKEYKIKFNGKIDVNTTKNGTTTISFTDNPSLMLSDQSGFTGPFELDKIWRTLFAIEFNTNLENRYLDYPEDALFNKDVLSGSETVVLRNDICETLHGSQRLRQLGLEGPSTYRQKS